MQQLPQYKGYEIIGTRNKNIVAQIQNNLHESEIKNNDIMSKCFYYEPPIVFVFTSYETMTKFIDENPR